MTRRHHRGFTLIELLTVIAIIMILTGMVAVGLGRMREKAKVARAISTMRQLQNSLAEYFTTHRESYPPRYGYLVQTYNAAIPEAQQYNFKAYVNYINAFRQMSYYDEFSDVSGHDTDHDGLISILEYSPLGHETGPNKYVFDSSRFVAPRPPEGDETQERRPYVYLPVSVAQVNKVAQYYYTLLHDDRSTSVQKMQGANATLWGVDVPSLDLHFPPLVFPPARYDAFALVGVGPGETTGGVIPAEPCEGEPPDSDPNSYHIRTLRAFYLASRDANENMKLDFDFSNRTGQSDDEDPATYEAKGLPGDCAKLPDPNAMPQYGPMILVYGYSQ